MKSYSAIDFVAGLKNKRLTFFSNPIPQLLGIEDFTIKVHCEFFIIFQQPAITLHIFRQELLSNDVHNNNMAANRRLKEREVIVVINRL